MLLLGCASLCAIVRAGDVNHDLLGKLTGNWVLRGTIGKRTITHDVNAKWVLNEEYVEIHEVSREKNKMGKPQYEAIVLVGWDAKKKEYDSQWLDTTAYAAFPPEAVGHAKPGGDNIEFYFGTPDDGIHTTFGFDRKRNGWSWNIDNLIKEKETPFARLRLTKRVR